MSHEKSICFRFRKANPINCLKCSLNCFDVASAVDTSHIAMWRCSQACYKNKLTPLKQNECATRRDCQVNTVYVSKCVLLAWMCKKATTSVGVWCLKSLIVFASSGETTKCVFMLGCVTLCFCSLP